MSSVVKVDFYLAGPSHASGGLFTFISLAIAKHQAKKVDTQPTVLKSKVAPGDIFCVKQKPTFRYQRPKQN